MLTLAVQLRLLRSLALLDVSAITCCPTVTTQRGGSRSLAMYTVTRDDCVHPSLRLGSAGRPIRRLRLQADFDLGAVRLRLDTMRVLLGLSGAQLRHYSSHVDRLG